MFRVAVCDDEKKIMEEVCRIIQSWNPEIEVDSFQSGEDLLADYHSYHAVFLDIDMKGMNGIETGKEIRKKDKETKIVYLTAYRDYVSGAFGVHAFQYLLKPIKENEIHGVLEELFRYQAAKKKKTILDFDTVNGLVCLSTEDIFYFEYENRRVRIATNAESYYLKERISEVGKRLNVHGFSMPHQSFVVNMLHVKNVKGSLILLDNGMEIPLAQKKQKIWKRELVSYLSGRMEVEV